MKEEVGLTFASALRAFLRQDPDIIMVGEIRDLETAEIAIKAALTGHFVLSNVHTNDCPSTVGRMMDIGVKPYLLSSAFTIVVAQRLLRRICAHCKTPVTSAISFSSANTDELTPSTSVIANNNFAIRLSIINLFVYLC